MCSIECPAQKLHKKIHVSDITEFGKMQTQFDLNLEANECLAEKIQAFKADEKNMKEINKFIDGVLLDAEHQVQKHQIEECEKNGNNIHRRIVARARGFCLRVIETISNCAASTSISHLPLRKS